MATECDAVSTAEWRRQADLSLERARVRRAEKVFRGWLTWREVAVLMLCLMLVALGVLLGTHVI